MQYMPSRLRYTFQLSFEMYRSLLFAYTHVVILPYLHSLLFCVKGISYCHRFFLTLEVLDRNHFFFLCYILRRHISSLHALRSYTQREGRMHYYNTLKSRYGSAQLLLINKNLPIFKSHKGNCFLHYPDRERVER